MDGHSLLVRAERPYTVAAANDILLLKTNLTRTEEKSIRKEKNMKIQPYVNSWVKRTSSNPARVLFRCLSQSLVCL